MQDQVMPTGPWEFDAEVSQVFEDMLARSIPQIEVMRRAVTETAVAFRQAGTDIVDLGSSRGDMVEGLLDKFGATNHFVLIEKSPAMLEILHQKFDSWASHSKVVQVLDLDLRDDFPPIKASVILSVLTLMFVPIECRQSLLSKVYRALLPGGALIVVEKVLGATAEIDELMVRLYYDKKRESGYTQEQIERKRLSLQGVLVPVTAAWNEELFKMAGFRQVDCFWRWMNFAGWVAVKD